MTTNKKGASAGAPHGTTVHLTSVQSGTTDFLTVLTTLGPVLTKHFTAEGVESYGAAKQFLPREIPVKDIHDLHRILTKMEKMPKSCVIRGKLSANPERGEVEGTVLRNNESFDDCEHHWVSLDIDKFKPFAADPVTEPVAAIREFLEDSGLHQFLDCSFHWQLSSSAGVKPGILKAHVWFWLETPWPSTRLYAWAKGLRGQPVDSSFFKRVQIHYTANPIFDDGIPDPVAVRSGFYQGARDTVPLAYDPSMVDAAAARVAGGSSTQLKDPSAKDNLIGAYHRAFEVETVLMEHLEGMFEPGSTERRWTWLDGGGTPEGAWVHDDRMHVGCSHHTWPLPPLVNLWDLVRVLKFGHLDKVEGDDSEAFDMENRPPHEMPSHKAMVAWVETLPEVQAEIKAEDITGWLNKFKETHTLKALETLAAEVKTIPLSRAYRDMLAKAYQTRLKAITGEAPSIGLARKDLAFDNTEFRGKVPDWARQYVWSCETDEFVNVVTKVSFSEKSFNLRYNRHMQHLADSEGRVPAASTYATDVWHLPCVDRTLYSPRSYLEEGGNPFFTMDGIRYLNTFRADIIKKRVEKLTKADKEAISIIEDHLSLLIPDPRERALFTDYLAYNIQKPGHKIRWSPILKGIEGDGKTAFSLLLGHCLGGANVRVLDSATLEKSDFTGWNVGQCVTFIEELKLQGHNRYDIANRLKPLVTNDMIEVHRKGKDPFTAPNTTNYIIFTNYEDAMPIAMTDRRYMNIWSPFSSPESLFGTIEMFFGLTHDQYFARLFKAMADHAAALYTWLYDRELSEEFNPDGRAPVTAARAEAIKMSVSEDEDIARLLIEDQAIGIYPHLVSARHLTELLRNDYRIFVRGGRVHTLMKNLGFCKGKQIKWRGKTCRCYHKGTEPGNYQAAFEAAEKERQIDVATDEMAS